MRLLVQFVGAGPADYTVMDSSDWASVGPVFVNESCVQGCSLGGYDRYLFEDLPSVGGCRFRGWNDDPILFPPGERHGVEMTFLPLTRDPRFGGAYNTKHEIRNFAEGARWTDRRQIEKTTWHPWSDMEIVKTSQVKDGVMLSPEELALYSAALTPHRWREWTEGLPPEEILHGQLRAQRAAGRWAKAKGTITYFQDVISRASGVHVATRERVLELTLPGIGFDSIVTVAGEGDQLGWMYTTPSNEPNSADWPNGAYRCQLDVGAGNGAVTYGALTQGASAGHMAKVDSGLTTDKETWTQDEAAFSSTGLKLATNTIDPTAGLVGDRFEVLISLEDARAHGGNATTTFDYDADSFADGPWPPAFPGGDDDGFIPPTPSAPDDDVAIYS